MDKKSETYKYSPIKSIVARDFRNLGSVEISFEHSPIVALTGENEAGKTSVTKAFAVCACHANPGEQKDFIRTGQDRFCVGINLEDGTAIARVKGQAENRYTVVYGDGRRWDITKLPPGEGIPKAVDEVMGIMCEPETKEFLHIRTYEDKLLFVVTPNSTNYKMMYNALKVDSIARAVKIGSNEINGIKRELYSSEIGIETLRGQVDSLRTMDLSSVISLKDRVKRQLDILNKIEAAKEQLDYITDAKNNLGALRVLVDEGISEIDENIAYSFSRVSDIRQYIAKANEVRSKYEKLCGLEEIDTILIDRVQSALDTKRGIARLGKKKEVYGELGEAQEVSTSILSKLEHVREFRYKLRVWQDKHSMIESKLTSVECLPENVEDTLNRMQTVIRDSVGVGQNRAVLKQYTDYVTGVENWFKQLGVYVEICPNCGEQIVISNRQ